LAIYAAVEAAAVAAAEAAAVVAAYIASSVILTAITIAIAAYNIARAVQNIVENGLSASSALGLVTSVASAVAPFAGLPGMLISSALKISSAAMSPHNKGEAIGLAVVDSVGSSLGSYGNVIGNTTASVAGSAIRFAGGAAAYGRALSTHPTVEGAITGGIGLYANTMQDAEDSAEQIKERAPCQ
jgi:hypothetical protein